MIDCYIGVFRLHNKRVFDVTPSQPMFYEFKFPEHVDMVLVKVIAEDDFCAMVAIQNITVRLEIKTYLYTDIEICSL